MHYFTLPLIELWYKKGFPVYSVELINDETGGNVC